MKKLLTLFLMGILLLGIAGCTPQSSANANQPTTDDVVQEPMSGDDVVPSLDVRGTITEITVDENGNVTGFFVEGVQEPDTTTDQAKVFITANTKIYKGDKEVGASELREGITVEVKFTDEPRIAIYPAQANAEMIKILE